MPLCHALSNGANHNSIAASVCKLLVVLVAPTQREQSYWGSSSCNLELRLHHYDVIVIAIGARAALAR